MEDHQPVGWLDCREYFNHLSRHTGANPRHCLQWSPPLVNVSVVLVACLGEKSLGLEDMLLAHDVTRLM